MTRPSLGVAVPSFEQPRFVAQSIRSLRALQVPFEAIIQDAGSSEETLSAIEQAVGGDPRITLVVEPDAGQSDAINKAWSVLIDRHAYLTWLNTDDVMDAKGVAALVAHLEHAPQAVVAYGDLDVIDEAGEVVGWVRAPARVRRYRLVYHHNLVPGICPVVRSSAIEKAGPLDVRLRFAMDHDLFVRLASLGVLQRVPVRAAAYRVHLGAKTWADKDASDAEVAAVRDRYRRLPVWLAEAARVGLRLAWWPTRRRYTRGVMRAGGSSFGGPEHHEL